jgi:hypothetical protein
VGLLAPIHIHKNFVFRHAREVQMSSDASFLNGTVFFFSSASSANSEPFYTDAATSQRLVRTMYDSWSVHLYTAAAAAAATPSTPVIPDIETVCSSALRRSSAILDPRHESSNECGIAVSPASSVPPLTGVPPVVPTDDVDEEDDDPDPP